MWKCRRVRADRLVAVLLLLSQREQVTAAEVAVELEVSERAARRDLDGLAMAGCPCTPCGPRRRVAPARRRPHRPLGPDRERGPRPVSGRPTRLDCNHGREDRAAQARTRPVRTLPGTGRGISDIIRRGHPHDGWPAEWDTETLPAMAATRRYGTVSSRIVRRGLGRCSGDLAAFERAFVEVRIFGCACRESGRSVGLMVDGSGFAVETGKVGVRSARARG